MSTYVVQFTDEVMPKKSKVKILCKYDYLNTQTDKLPLFISFGKNNLLSMELLEEVIDDTSKFNELITLVSSWFRGFKVIAVYRNDK